MRRLWMLAAFGLGLAGGSSAGAAPPVELGYLVTGAGLSLMRFDYALAVSDHDYRIDFTARTLGVVDWFTGLRLVSSSSGALAGTQAAPEWYEMKADTKDGPRRVDIAHLPGGELHFEAVPATAELDRKPLTPLAPESLPGTVDPLAGVLEVSRLIASGAVCDGRIPIFDGRHRYDFVLSHAGWDQVPPEDDDAYTGTAERCTARIEKLGGYPIEKVPEPDRPTTVWIARPGPDEPPVMVAFAAEGRWGKVHGHLVQFRHGAVHREAGKIG
ncbi:MAG TPA: DUF3108 domain-containing protein [Aliidongia sp.]|nr:DUF3108 domain-containing protein [Aliidongia sp.]